MSPVYMNPQHSSPFPFLELKGDQQLNIPTIIGYVRDHVTSSNNTYFSGSNLENHHATTQFLSMDYSRCNQEKVVEKLILSHFDNRDQGNQKIDIIKNDEKPKKCKKIRILQKTTAAATTKYDKGSRDQHHLATAQPLRATSHHETNNNINGIRTCTDCHTTTTPLWRSGPQGPKSLCNACGIRQRKARRAAAMAAATAGVAKDSTLASSTTSSTIVVEAPKIVVEDITSENKLPLKKRSKTFSASWNYNNNNNNNNINDDNNDIFVDNNYRREEKHYFEDFATSSRSSKNNFKANSSQRVFPRDEEEGAILLMALSCGLACSS